MKYRSYNFVLFFLSHIVLYVIYTKKTYITCRDNIEFSRDLTATSVTVFENLNINVMEMKPLYTSFRREVGCVRQTGTLEPG